MHKAASSKLDVDEKFLLTNICAFDGNLHFLIRKVFDFDDVPGANGHNKITNFRHTHLEFNIIASTCRTYNLKEEQINQKIWNLKETVEKTRFRISVSKELIYFLHK